VLIVSVASIAIGEEFKFNAGCYS